MVLIPGDVKYQRTTFHHRYWTKGEAALDASIDLLYSDNKQSFHC